MDPVSFMYGFSDELEKRAGIGSGLRKADIALGHAASKVYGKTKGAAKKVLSEASKGGWHVTKKLAPYALLAGIPLYFGTKAISEGFGRGVAEEADKRLSYER